jgi:hypothetical protein
MYKSNVENLDALAARYRTLEYEQDRTAKALSISRAAQRKAEGDAAGWKMRMADLERRLALEEGKTRELREDVGRARKAVENVRIAAAVRTSCVSYRRQLECLARLDQPEEKGRADIVARSEEDAGAI